MLRTLCMLPPAVHADEDIVKKVQSNIARCEPAFRDAKVGPGGAACMSARMPALPAMHAPCSCRLPAALLRHATSIACAASCAGLLLPVCCAPAPS